MVLGLALSAKHKVVVPVQGDWEFRQIGKNEWLPAEVPGVVQTDLFRNGKIPHPYYRMSERELTWIENADWEYRLQFDVQGRLLKFGHLELVFEGLDTYADVYVNDSLFLSSDNMFMAYEKSVKGFLKVGVNELRVVFHSPIGETVGQRMMYPYELPMDSDDSETRVSSFVRKSPFHFGWDFAPRYVTMGIWKPVTLRLWDHGTIRDMQFRTLDLTDQQALVDGLLFIDGEGAGEDFPSQVRIMVDGKMVWDTTLYLDGQEKVIPFLLTINEPKRWWPRGYGEPHLYELKATIGKSGNVDDSLAIDYGLRTVKLVQEPDEEGIPFYFEVNGTPIYAKGAGYIPEDVFLPQAREKQLTLRKYILDAHFNMLRVWGGGTYQTDEFYEWCDQKGILVWQDFVFACAMYPHGPDFHNRVSDELVGQLLRLRNHPSIALWCGNNEIEVAWENWGWQAKYGLAPMDSFNLWQGYQELFHQVIPGLIDRYDPDRPYISSSPLSNWGKAENFTRHDNHYWGVWHGTDDFDAYRTNVPRFMSEFGMQSFPVVESLEPYAEASDLKLGSEWMTHRQKSYKGNDFLFDFTERWLGTPKDSRSALLMSQLTQAIALDIAISSQRFRTPYCMGTLYWQFNDCWPGPSWSTIDYEGRPKAAYYYVKRLFADKMINLDLYDKGGNEYVVSDQGKIGGSIWMEVATLDGKSAGNAERTIRSEDGARVFQTYWRKMGPYAKLVKGKEVAFLNWIEDGDTLASKIVHQLPMVKMKLFPPTYEVTVAKMKGGFRINISSDVFAKGVRLNLPGTKADYSDQFFDLFPGHGHSVEVFTDASLSAAQFKEQLEIESLVDWRK